MKFSKLACLVGCFVAGAVGFGAAACSSSSSGGGSGGDSGTAASDTGTGTTTDTGTGSGGDTGTTTGGGDAGADAACETKSLHPGEADGDIYCPFAVAADGGEATLYCGAGGTATKLCCVSGEVGSSYPPSVCGATCAFEADAGNTTIQCEDPATDCPSGNVCCGAATGGKLPLPYETCAYDKLSDWSYTKCEQGTACTGTGEFQLCTATAECPSGKTCTVFTAKGLDLGFCN